MDGEEKAQHRLERIVRVQLALGILALLVVVIGVVWRLLDPGDGPSWWTMGYGLVIAFVAISTHRVFHKTVSATGGKDPSNRPGDAAELPAVERDPRGA